MPAPQEGSAEERTEQASQFRREEFRKKGTVALSRELLSVAVLAAFGIALYFGISRIYSEFGEMAQRFFGFKMVDIGREEFLDLRGEMFKYWGWMALPVLGVVSAAAVLCSAAQVGFYVTLEPLAPDWNRVNPVLGFQRLFSMKGGVEAIKTLIKMIVVAVVVYFFVKAQAREVGHHLALTLPQSVSLTLSSVGRLFVTLIVSLSFISILDYAYQRYQLEKQMRMTKHEAKEEFKLREGDPLIRARIRSVQRRMASRRMMEAVPKSDVVVTNPTHLAVALQFDAATMSAPKVVAKGAGVIAQKIKEVARFHQIPCVENKPLARTLYKEIDINQYIPRELYKAVAQVLAYVYRLKGRLANG